MQVAEHQDPQLVDPRDPSHQIAESRRAIEAIEPQAQGGVGPLEISFDWVRPGGTQPETFTYLQAELGFFPAQQFTTKITEILDSFLKGEMGMKLGDLFRGDVAMPDDFNPDTVNNVVDENMEIFKAFIQLVQIMPDFQLEVFCLSLGIPRVQWDWAKQQMQEPPHRGGLTVEEGFDLIINFIKQNGVLVRKTVVGKAEELATAFRIHGMGQEPPIEGTATETTPEVSSPGGTPSSTFFPDTPESV